MYKDIIDVLIYSYSNISVKSQFESFLSKLSFFGVTPH